MTHTEDNTTNPPEGQTPIKAPLAETKKPPKELSNPNVRDANSSIPNIDDAPQTPIRQKLEKLVAGIQVSTHYADHDDTILDNQAKMHIADLEKLVQSEIRQARLAELAPIHAVLQKPKNYESMDTAQQQVWVIMAVGTIGSHLDERVAQLQEGQENG